MTALDIEGGLTHPALRPGAVLTFDRGSADPSGLRLSVLGCSGPVRDRFTYDRTADRVEVEVQPGSREGTRVLYFTAYFPNATQQRVDGSFVYETVP